MDRHRVERMTRHGHGGRDILFRNLLKDRTAAVTRFTHFRSSLLIVTAALAGCSGDLSTLDPAGPSAASVATLWWIMFTGGTLIFAATSVVLAVAWAKPRLLGANPQRLLILWGGLVLPSIILAALVLSAFALGERLIGASGSPAPLRIEAVAERWMWSFRYPTNGAVSEQVLHIPAGEPVEFAVTSEDVIHGFWLPRLGGKIDAVPGHTNMIRLQADRPGRYGGVCAEFCGEGHEIMRFEVVAHPLQEYEAVLDRLAAGEAP